MGDSIIARWQQKLRSPAFLRAAAPYAIIAVLAVLFMLPVLLRLYNTGTGDWDQHCFFDEVPRKTILEYGQFPFWNPYASGGRPALGNPQYNFYRPTFLLALAFGCVVGLKIDLLILYFVGMLGMFLLMRYYKASTLPALLSSAMFGMTSYFALRLVEGHTTFWSIMFIPYAFLFLLKSFKQHWYVVPAGIAYGLTLIYGGVAYATVPFGIFLGVYAIVLAFQQRNIQPIIRTCTVGLLAILLTAFFTIPTLYQAYEHPRIADTRKHFLPLSGLIDALLNHDPRITALHFDGQDGRWHEYALFIGIIPLVLFFVGIALFWKKELAILIAGFVMLIFGLGNVTENAPWNWLHALPAFHGFQLPYRFNIFFIFAAAIFAGLAATFLLKRWNSKHYVRAALICLLILGIADIFFVGYRMHATSFPIPAPAVIPEPEFRQFTDLHKNRTGAYSSMHYNLLSNRGTLNPFDPLPHSSFAAGFNEPDYRGELYLEGNGTASYALWTPNKLVVHVSVPAQTQLIINQNYDEGWRVLDGRPAQNVRGLLATTVTPSDKEITFRYRTPYWLLGWAVFLATCAGLFAMRRFRPGRGAASRQGKRNAGL
jgi:hypothetical protein